MKLYVNGDEKASNESSIVKTHSFPRDSMFLGKDWTGYSYFKGSLEEFILYSGALADTTIKGLPHNINWPLYQGENDHRGRVAFNIEGNGYIDMQVEFNPGYRYSNSITQDTVTSFPRLSTVELTFQADAGWQVDEVIINGDTITPTPPNWFYDVPDYPNNGTVEVIFKQ